MKTVFLSSLVSNFACKFYTDLSEHVPLLAFPKIALGQRRGAGVREIGALRLAGPAL